MASSKDPSIHPAMLLGSLLCVSSQTVQSQRGPIRTRVLQRFISMVEFSVEEKKQIHLELVLEWRGEGSTCSC